MRSTLLDAWVELIQKTSQLCCYANNPLIALDMPYINSILSAYEMNMTYKSICPHSDER